MKTVQWRVGLEAYVVNAVHGYYDEEHLAPQPFIFTVWATLAGNGRIEALEETLNYACLLYTSPSPRDRQKSRMPSSA